MTPSETHPGLGGLFRGLPAASTLWFPRPPAHLLSASQMVSPFQWPGPPPDLCSLQQGLSLFWLWHLASRLRTLCKFRGFCWRAPGNLTLTGLNNRGNESVWMTWKAGRTPGPHQPGCTGCIAWQTGFPSPLPLLPLGAVDPTFCRLTPVAFILPFHFQEGKLDFLKQRKPIAFSLTGRG